MAKRTLNAEYMKDVSRGLKIVFNNALKTDNKDYLKVATEVKANTITVDYSWLSDLPSMREWIGDRDLKELSAWNYQIIKKDWEASIKVHRDVIEYDNLGIVKPRIMDLANAVKDHYNNLIFGLLEGGNAGVCYDGNPFFSTEHTINGAKFSNIGAKALNEASFLEAFGLMGRLVKENGEPLRIRPNLIVVPPELESVANELFLCERNKAGASNALYKKVDVFVCYDLKSTKNWYLLDTNRALKPIILQVNKTPEFVAQDSLDDEAAFMRKEFRYGVDTEDNAGYGLWQLAYGAFVK